MNGSVLQIEVRYGDIARQDDCEAVVNAANARLQPGGGVAGALHRAAGPELDEACRPLAPIEVGQAVITDGFQLPNRYVIHCLGPVYGVDEPGERLLADCYRNALDLAEERGVTSIAFPVISTGAFGFPFERGVRVACGAIREQASALRQVRRVCLVVPDRKAQAEAQSIVDDQEAYGGT